MTIRTLGRYLPQIAENVYIDPQACIIGRVQIGKNSSVWPMAVIRGDVHDISIGERTSVQDNSTLHVTHESAFNPRGFGLTIGNDVTIGHNVVLHGCTIENECLLGIGSIILDGAILRKHVLLGAGSLVPPGKELEGGYLWLGNPVKRVRPLMEAEIQYFIYSAEHYVRVKNMYY